MYLVPELADHLRQTSLAKVQEAVAEYNDIAPLWFIGQTENAQGETATQHYYDVNAMFQAKAQILKQPYEELVKYLDVPIFARGDLFYIQNLVSTIEAAPVGPPTPPSKPRGLRAR